MVEEEEEDPQVVDEGEAEVELGFEEDEEPQVVEDELFVEEEELFPPPGRAKATPFKARAKAAIFIVICILSVKVKRLFGLSESV